MNRHHVHTRFRRARANAAQPEPEGVARLRAELADKSRRLEETLLNLDNLVSPLDWLDAGDGFPGFGSWRINRPASRAQDLTHAPLAYLNEEEWRTHVALARDLVTRNHLALGFRDHVSNFVGPVAVSFVLKGQAPGSSGDGEEAAIDPLVRDCTMAWDEWRELAEWGEGEEDREAECRQRLIVEGECTLRFFKGEAHSDGLPYVRHVEPELIRTPPDHTTSDSWGWGVRTAENDDERELGLWLCDALNVSEGRVVESGDYVRVKANVDRTVKRGLSDFFPVAEHLRKVLGLLDNMGHVARLQAAIAWWEQYPAATFEQVQNQIRAGADYTRPKLPPGAGGASTDVTSYEAGTVVRTEAGRDVKPGPIASGVAGFAQVEALLLRGVGFRWGCPGYFSGDADASFASVLVTGSPFVRITEARQEKLKGFAKSVATRVLEFCEKSGRLPKGASKRVRPVATSRPVVIADEEKQARTFLSLYQQNVADPVEFIRERGGDPKVVAANIAAWQKKFPPPGGDMSGGMGDPSATPPGSAGGDGSSPNDDPMGDAYAEARERARISEANPSHPVGVRYQTGGGQWRVNKRFGKNIRSVPASAPKQQKPVKGGAQQQTGASGTPKKGVASGKPKATDARISLSQALPAKGSDASRLAAFQKWKPNKGMSGDATPAKAEAGTSVVLGSKHTWQSGGSGAKPNLPVGEGHDFRHDDGKVVRLTDAKTRGAKEKVVVTDKERLSKIAETLQVLESGKKVVPGYVHTGEKTGMTFVTGFVDGDEATYSGALVCKNLGDWKKAVRGRLKSNDLNAPLPALQLHNGLTTDFQKWTPRQAGAARKKYEEASAFLANNKQYQKLIQEQARARVTSAAQKALSVAGNDSDVVIRSLEPHLKNNPVFVKELARVKELKQAVHNKATLNELAGVVAGKSPNQIAEFRRLLGARLAQRKTQKTVK